MTFQGDAKSTYFTADATTDGQTTNAHRQRLLAVVSVSYTHLTLPTTPYV